MMSAKTGAAIAMTTFAWRRLAGSNGWPGGTKLSPTAARTIVSSPAISSAPSTMRIPLSAGDNGNRPVANEATGTIAVPDPRAPDTVTYTLNDPYAMSQS